MSDGPEKMWRETIAPNKMYPSGGSFYYEKHKPTTVSVVEYTRTDLIPDPLADPRVKALVDAATDYLFWKDKFDRSTHEDVMESVAIEAHMKDAENLMRAALAAMKGGGA